MIYGEIDVTRVAKVKGMTPSLMHYRQSKL